MTISSKRTQRRSQRTASPKQNSTYTSQICSPVVCVCVFVSNCPTRSPVNTVEQAQVSRGGKKLSELRTGFIFRTEDSNSIFFINVRRAVSDATSPKKLTELRQKFKYHSHTGGYSSDECDPRFVCMDAPAAKAGGRNAPSQSVSMTLHGVLYQPRVSRQLIETWTLRILYTAHFSRKSGAWWVATQATNENGNSIPC